MLIALQPINKMEDLINEMKYMLKFIIQFVKQNKDFIQIVMGIFPQYNYYIIKTIDKAMTVAL